MFNPMSWFKTNEVDIEFTDTIGHAMVDAPIRLAKREPLHFLETQKKNSGKLKFHNCPGMIDYATVGYILPAWETIKIKANKAGTTVFYPDRNTVMSRAHSQPVRMAVDIVDGVFQPEDGIPLQPWKCDSPWKVSTAKDISAFLIPASFHSKFLDDIYVYPGIVDYKNFMTANFIFAPKRECELTIAAGEPLLQVIPFYNKPIKASYSLADIEQLAKSKSHLFSAIKHQYKKHATKKKFTLD